MVDVGVTVVEPTRVEVENDPGVIATDDAFVIFQESVEGTPEATREGDAVKEAIVGRGATVIVAVAVTLP